MRASFLPKRFTEPDPQHIGAAFADIRADRFFLRLEIAVAASGDLQELIESVDRIGCRLDGVGEKAVVARRSGRGAWMRLLAITID